MMTAHDVALVVASAAGGAGVTVLFLCFAARVVGAIFSRAFIRALDEL